MNLVEAHKLQMSGRYAEALEAFRENLETDLDKKVRGEALNCFALCCMALERFGQAYDAAKEAVEIDMTRWDYKAHLAQAAHRLDLRIDAVEYAREAAQLTNDPRAWSIFANNCKMFHNNGEALVALQHLAEIDPNNDTIPLSIADIYNQRGDRENEKKFLLKTLEINPNQPDAHFFMSQILGREWAHPKETLRHALLGMDSPNLGRLSRWNAGLCQLALGDYTEGWANYDTRLGFEQLQRDLAYPMQRFDKPIWTGQKNVRVHIQPEQGFGDMFQFCRYVNVLKDNYGCDVRLETHSQMLALMANSFPGVKVVQKSPDWPRVEGLDLDFDYHLPIMSAPNACGTTLDSVPCKTPYLYAEPAKIARWKKKITTLPGLRVGLCWSGENRHHNEAMHLANKTRSMTFEKMAPLLDVGGVSFVSLQYGKPSLECKDPRVHDFTREIWDFSDTAAIIHHLDFVISVDTSVVHLAGAMNKPTFLLNRYDSCWRWLLETSSSVWYPTISIFRQPEPHMWEPAVEKAKEALAHAAGTG